MGSHGVATLLNSENYLNADSLHPLLEYAQSIPAIKAEIGMRDHRESDLSLLSFEDFTRGVTFVAQWVAKPRRLNVIL